jgi:hypothetical protein
MTILEHQENGFKIHQRWDIFCRFLAAGLFGLQYLVFQGEGIWHAIDVFGNKVISQVTFGYMAEFLGMSFITFLPSFFGIIVSWIINKSNQNYLYANDGEHYAEKLAWKIIEDCIKEWDSTNSIELKKLIADKAISWHENHIVAIRNRYRKTNEHGQLNFLDGSPMYVTAEWLTGEDDEINVIKKWRGQNK